MQTVCTREQLADVYWWKWRMRVRVRVNVALRARVAKIFEM